MTEVRQIQGSGQKNQGQTTIHPKQPITDKDRTRSARKECHGDINQGIDGACQKTHAEAIERSSVGFGEGCEHG